MFKVLFLTKLDLLASELFEYDILAFSETCPNPGVSVDDL